MREFVDVVGSQGSTSGCGFGLDPLDRGVEPVGVPLEPATLERFTSSMFRPTTSAGIAWAKRV
jgi:hypothetical protein